MQMLVQQRADFAAAQVVAANLDWRLHRALRTEQRELDDRLVAHRHRPVHPGIWLHAEVVKSRPQG